VTSREPHSTHIALLQKVGCHLVTHERIVRRPGISRAKLAPRFRHLTDEELMTSSTLIRAMKPGLSDHSQTITPASGCLNANACLNAETRHAWRWCVAKAKALVT
jgi:hypothetical protein